MKKSIISLFLAASMLTATTSATVFAEEAEIGLTASTESLDSYIDRILPSFLYEGGYSDSECYYVSLPINLSDSSYSNSEDTYVFVFQNNEIIGQMRIYCAEGRRYTAFTWYVSDEVKKMYETGATSFSQDVALLSNDEIGMSETVTLSSPIVKSRQVMFSEEAFQENSIMKDIEVASYEIEGIEYVPNENIEEYGNTPLICWEACLAMRYNYENNASITAMDVYDYLNRPDPHKITDAQIIKAYKHYGMSVKFYDKVLASNEAYQVLKGDIPIQMSVDDLNSDINHAILLFGIYVYDDHTNFCILDPDMGSSDGLPRDPDTKVKLQYISVTGTPNVVSDNFIYNTSYNSHSYKWYRSLY